jgi:predicted methyltransferase
MSRPDSRKPIPRRSFPPSNFAAQATGLTQDSLTARSDIASVIEAVKAMGLKLTIKST